MKKWNILLLFFAILLAGCAPAAPAEAATLPAATEPRPVTAVYEMGSIPENWDSPAERSEQARFLRSLTGSRLYELSADGLEILPSLADSLPADVTAEYAGQYHVPAEAVRGYAFRIRLNGAACWEDGTPITAGDYLESLEAQLPDFAFLANATAFLSGGAKPTEEIVPLAQAGFGSAAEAAEAGVREFYLDLEHFWGLEAGWTPIGDRTRYRDYAMAAGQEEQYVSAAYLYRTYLADGAGYAWMQGEFVGISPNRNDPLTIADVGMVQTGDLELTLILDAPTTSGALALKMADFCLTTGGGRSCGPWRVVSAGENEIELEPNPRWWGEAGENTTEILKIRRS